MAAWLSLDQLEKTGPDLFKEMLRYMPTAEYEDYFKNGAWKEDLMRLDLQLVVAHRLGAGAPNPLPLEEVPEVELPAAAAKPVIQAPSPMGVIKNAAVTPASALGANSQVAGGGIGAVASGVQELRLIALLVTKWKLEPTRTKNLLSTLPPQKRHQVIQTFKTEAAPGAPATDALEAFVKKAAEAKDAGSTATAATTTATPKAPGIQPRPAGALTVVRPGVAGATAMAGSSPAVAKPGGLRPQVVAPATPGFATAQGSLALKRPLSPGPAQGAAAGMTQVEWKRPRPMGTPMGVGGGMAGGFQKGMQKGMDKGGWGRPPMGGGWGCGKG
eukprot:CAMPEP_0178440410 /NCGR_PEP_ID=MMETSP0689_2-20121128/36770_1 /TAXON_ID=160604 /ORGANISM="Amphidinium massartii, Strain CS-259" /LENGTH=328 /DNA_ID=CAMNT_0020063195 /DNA_START=94 /DNA_END=1076 /DNA_ORIENTATION=+